MQKTFFYLDSLILVKQIKLQADWRVFILFFKMFAEESGSLTNRRASDANYDPVQMDMSEV